ncbi:MAG TPA: hypothetical protein ENK07_04675 [Bacteroidetes bacterium]|nr:hypothetical protein [Bacteroidota bacterium]
MNPEFATKAGSRNNASHRCSGQRRAFRRVLVLAAVFVFAASARRPGAAGQEVDLPREHWAYEFLERLEVRGLIDGPLARVRPWSRAQTLEMIRQVQRALARNPSVLSPTEKALFRQLQSDFSEELGSPAGLPPEPHLLSIRDSTLHLHLDGVLQERIPSRHGSYFTPAELRSETTMGGIIRALVEPGLWVGVDVRNTAIRGGIVPPKERFDPAQGAPFVTSGKNVFQDKAAAYFGFKLPWFRAQIGRDAVWWGPSQREALTLSPNLPYFDLLRADARWKRLRFTYVHAELRSHFGRKYLAAHRIEWEVKRGLYLAGSETVIYGNRPVEMAYLNPVMFYHVAEHYLGDLDNNNMSFEAWWRARPGLVFYGEFFIDDMTLSAPLFKYWGNKFAFSAGCHWANPLGISDSDLLFEYARIEPFVYTHYDSINRYQHYNRSIGHWLGPDGDDWNFAFSRYFGRDLRLRLAFTQTRKGKGSLNVAHTNADPQTKKFLEGTVERQRALHVSLRQQLWRDVFVSLRYEYWWVKNPHRRPGRATGKTFLASLYVNH